MKLLNFVHFLSAIEQDEIIAIKYQYMDKRLGKKTTTARKTRASI